MAVECCLALAIRRGTVQVLFMIVWDIFSVSVYVERAFNLGAEG